MRTAYHDVRHHPFLFMQKNELVVEIDRAPSVVFAFTIDPNNTPHWIETIVSEKTSEWPIRVGTIYENISTDGGVSRYTVVAFDENRLFELVSLHGGYHVRYTYASMENGKTRMTYLEWMETGELQKPFSMDCMRRLKSVIENLH